MKFFGSIVLAAASATLAAAQATYNSTTGNWHCPIANGTYCAKDSLQGSLIVLCVNGVGQTGDCSGHIQSRPPIDVYDAQCYQLSASAGNATCSKNCTVFPDEGLPYPVSGQCTYSQASKGSNIPGFGFIGGNSTTGVNGTTTGVNGTTTGGNGTTPTHTPGTPISPTNTAKSVNAAAAPTPFVATAGSIAALAIAAALAL